MGAYIIRKKLSIIEALRTQNAAREFFRTNPRRRVFKVGDTVGVWFHVRRDFILEDIAEHTVTS